MRTRARARGVLEDCVQFETVACVFRPALSYLQFSTQECVRAYRYLYNDCITSALYANTPYMEDNDEWTGDISASDFFVMALRNVVPSHRTGDVADFAISDAGICITISYRVIEDCQFEDVKCDASSTRRKWHATIGNFVSRWDIFLNLPQIYRTREPRATVSTVRIIECDSILFINFNLLHIYNLLTTYIYLLNIILLLSLLCMHINVFLT